MKRRSFLAAIAALAAATPALLAQCPLFITGPVPAGFNCTYSNVDVVIQDVQIDPAALTNRTFTVTVYNGTITIQGYGGLNGTGADGTDAHAVSPCDGPSTAAIAPNPGCTIKLSSLKDPTGTRARPLGIFGGSITTSGGHGGSGASNASDDFRHTPCVLCAGGDALASTPGGAGGSVSLVSDGPITVTNITSNGGSGGYGASGASATWGGAGHPSAGGAGGPGGKISVTQNGTSAGPTFYGGISSNGGDGFPGGAGGIGVQGSTAGAAGGNGGSGGAVVVSGPAPSLYVITTRGGGAGMGGNGGSAVPFNFYLCEHCDPPHEDVYRSTCAAVQSGWVGGDGGKGGPGGAINISSAGDVSIVGYGAYVSSHGGSGAMGGAAGAGSSGYHYCPPCPDNNPGCGPDLAQCPAVAVNGHQGASGAGGAGGPFAVKCHAFFAGNTPIITVGGCGGNGNNGIAALCVTRATTTIPGVPCNSYSGSVVCNEISSIAGAPGGAGGASGNITLTIQVALVPPYPAASFCGGNGGRGGNGGDGFTCTNWIGAASPGGQGGLAGASGVYAISGLPSSICLAPADYNGECGVPQVQDQNFQYRGQAGTDGVVYTSCPCVEG